MRGFIKGDKRANAMSELRGKKEILREILSNMAKERMKKRY